MISISTSLYHTETLFCWQSNYAQTDGKLAAQRAARDIRKTTTFGLQPRAKLSLCMSAPVALQG